MADLIAARTTDGAAAGVAITGPCTVMVSNASVFDGATATVEIWEDDTSGEYVNTGITFSAGYLNSMNIDGRGSYYLRVVTNKAGAATSITIVANQ